MSYHFFYSKSSPFSQFYPSSFTVAGTEYSCAEQYMMAEKARAMNDPCTMLRILAEHRPTSIKRLGREVRNFDESRWTTLRVAVVARGNRAKFSQNPELRAILLATAPNMLVEASPVDRIWGIGLSTAAARHTPPDRWPGLNLLGLTLTAIRNEFIAADAKNHEAKTNSK